MKQLQQLLISKSREKIKGSDSMISLGGVPPREIIESDPLIFRV